MTDKNKKLKPGVQARKKDHESVGRLSRRFLQKDRQSEVLLEARKRQHLQPKKNRRARRASALVVAERRKEYRNLRKWGKAK